MAALTSLERRRLEALQLTGDLLWYLLSPAEQSDAIQGKCVYRVFEEHAILDYTKPQRGAR